MSVPPPPPPLRYVSKQAVPKPISQAAATQPAAPSKPTETGNGTQAPQGEPQPKRTLQLSSSNSAAPVPPTNSTAGTTNSSIVDRQEIQRLEQQLEHQLSIAAELARENALLQKRVASFMTESSRDEPSGMASWPPQLLVARIRRLEAALQLEALERDELETKCEAQNRALAKLAARLPPE